MPDLGRSEWPAVVTWRPGRRAVDQTAIMREHAECCRCLDERSIVVGWENGNAVWGPCSDCGERS